MLGSSPQPRPLDGGDEHDLLSALLTSDVPSRRGQLRPTRLRSTTQQRAEALRGFLLRTWVDKSLSVVERLLVLAAVVTFVYWLADGYGRDWLYAWQNAQAASSELHPTPAIQLPALTMPQAEQLGSALPFTRPEDALTPAPNLGAQRDGFLAPQPLRDTNAVVNPRPQRLHIPAIAATMRVDEVFLSNGEWQVAEYAAGYHHGTALPGSVGNSVISGHAGLRGAVFRDLGRLKPGDTVIVETDAWRYIYHVRSLISVWPHQVEVMAPTPTSVLTLITCTNWDLQRLIVVADLAEAHPL
ncbi:MAG: sortase [Candidatus Viridilinea halotolerans]|uniref:Sortase n=1 Tax=Candidatus Viridilinea halotolerans TaxID=2491704 RepID=A0A426UBA8_9CHLR|nr:MAG: sortase [Candidatus Viridilinea halotolerans]